MRLFALALALALLAAVARAWEKLDHEIFELYDDIKTHEPTTDWYDLLGISPSSDLAEINRAYRQLSKKYHPDKLSRLSSSQSASESKRFQRLSLVVNILRSPEMRKRYNFFRKNGVPVWRGTGYLYRRWRPGFGAVLVGLLLFVSGMQYLFQSLSYWRAQQRIRDLEASGQGARMRVRGEQSQRQMSRQMRRRQKSGMQRGESPTPPAELDDSGVEGDDMGRGQLNTVGVINPYAVLPPSMRRVLVVSLPLLVANTALRLVGLAPTPVESEAEETETEEAELPESNDSEHRQQIADALENLDANDGFANTEAKAKKAAKKAAKAQARRRRVPVV